MVETPHYTTDTPQAAYLIQAGFNLLKIIYETKPNSKRQATFVFDASNLKLQECVNLYNQGKAVINLALYEHTRSGLLDRIMRGLP